MFRISALLSLFLTAVSIQSHSTAFYNKKGDILISEDGTINTIKLRAYAQEFKWGPTSIENINRLPPEQRIDFARKLARKKKTPIYGPAKNPKPGNSSSQTSSASTDRHRQKPLPTLPQLPQGVFSLEDLSKRSWPRSRTPRNWIKSLKPTVQFYEAHQDKLSAEEQESFEYLKGRIKNPTFGPGDPSYPNPFDPNDRPAPTDDEAIDSGDE